MITPSQFNEKVIEAVADLHSKVSQKTPAERLRFFAEHVDKIDEQLSSKTPIDATVTALALGSMLEAEANELASVVRRMMRVLQKVGAVGDTTNVN